VTIYDRSGNALADINLPDPDIDYDSRLNSVVALEVLGWPLVCVAQWCCS
jgi:hypothetical protein